MRAMRWMGLPVLVLGTGCQLLAGLGDPELRQHGTGSPGGGGSGGVGGSGMGTSSESTSTSGGTGGTPADPSCFDGKRNGNETGKDCGGGVCPACPDGEGCKFGSDCTSFVCTAGGACAPPACDDGIRNGDESDKDCGGSCPGCVLGDTCTHSTDCADATCRGGKCADPFVWAKRAGDASDQQANVVALRPTTDNIIVTGSFAGAIDFGLGAKTSAGGQDAFLTYLLPDGDEFWTLRFGDSAEQHGTGLAVDNGGNMLFAGDFLGQINVGGGSGKTHTNTGTSPAIFLGSLDVSKQSHGTKRFGTATQKATGIATDSLRNVLLAGEFTSSIDFGGGPITSQGASDIFVTKLDPSCNHIWSKRFGNSANQVGPQIAVDSMNNVLLAGSVGGSIDFGGGAVTAKLFLAKLHPNGDHFWSKGLDVFGDTYGIAVDAAGNVVITGSFAGAIDLGGGVLTSGQGAATFVAKFDPGGNHVWSRAFPAGSVYPSAIATDGAGNVLVVGDFYGTLDFGGGPMANIGTWDIFVLKLDPNGEYAWAKRYGGSAIQHAASVAVDSKGEVVLTGSFKGSIDFGGGALTSAGGNDVFIAKLAP